MSKSKKAAKSAIIIMILTLMSKFFGFIREMLIASKFGSGDQTDAFFVALTATSIIMGAIGVALSTTIIPIFSEIKEKRGKRIQYRYMSNIINIIFILSTLLILLGYIFSPLIIKLLAKGFEGEQFELAVSLNRIGLPIVLFTLIGYIFSGYLQSEERFIPTAFAGIPFNIVYIVYLILVSDKYNIQGLMFAAIIAAFAQVIIQVIPALRSNYSHSLIIDLKDPYIKKSLLLVIPIIIGTIVQQINAIVDKTLASELIDGSISALYYSSKLNTLIITVFVTAILTVIFPMLSIESSKNELNGVIKIIDKGINVILIITIPAAIGIMILARPIVEVAYQRGAFDTNDTLMTYTALVFYTPGIIGISIRNLLSRVYYSLQDTKTPMINGIIAVSLNIILNMILVRYMDHRGLALATSLSSIIAMLLLFFSLKKKIKNINVKLKLITFVKISFSAFIMGIFINPIYTYFYQIIKINDLINNVITLVITISLSVCIYIIASLFIKVEEIVMIKDIIKQKIKF
ncbi:murein biosynthesis integral membrane protein MurJ [Senegalia sp. (in: firmicutes)]|uniref:murein biosynthesis integral membrane protein MurJ n=1 Tax=Senegalia sp. (in: firmicutes) TaxID=1924098 RepID=UPI003F962A3D